MSQKCISVGPWGGTGGSPWDDGASTGVKQIIVVSASAIDSIKIEYDRSGTSVWSERHGGNGGNATQEIVFDYPKEYITCIRGHYGPIYFGCPTVIRSLTFETNYKQYGPFGVQQGSFFTLPMSGSKIVGFHGRSGWFLDSIGIYLCPLYVETFREPVQEKSMVPASPPLTRSQSLKSQDGNGNKSYNINILLPVAESSDTVKFNSAKMGSLSENSSKIYSFQLRDIGDSSTPKVVPVFGSERSSVNGEAVSLGPWGGMSGSEFDDGIYTGIRQIVLNRGAGIASIQIEYDRNGLSIWGNRHGGSTSGYKTNRIVFDYPFELLTSITGYYGTILMMGPSVIKSLTFHTTRGKHGPFGEEQGKFFSSTKLSLAEGRIVGFHGRKGWYLDAIGVHVLEGPVEDNISQSGRPSLLDGMSNGESFNRSNSIIPITGPRYEEVLQGVVREPVPVGPGPWGGDGGRPWDDGVFTGVKQIVITRADVILSIQFEYDRNGQSVWSMKHGGFASDVTTNRIKFDYPKEMLTGISGFYGKNRSDKDPKVVRSLTLHTSRGKYGPFGEELGKFFTSAQSGGKVVGFHGRSSSCLDAIGVHMQHWLSHESKLGSRLRLSKYLSSTSK